MNNMKVAAVVMRSSFGEIEANLAKTERFVRQAAIDGADMISFPELSITGYSLKREIRGLAEPVPGGPSTSAVVRMAAEHCIVIIAGLVEKTGEDSAAISQIIVEPCGSIGVYRKIHLSPGERDLFQAGCEIPVFTVNDTIIGIQLCFDAHFPELSTLLALKGSEVFFISHASPAMESHEKKQDRWLRYLSTRAYDNSAFVVACNQTGDGGGGIHFRGVALVIDPMGEVIGSTSGAGEKMIYADLEAEILKSRRSTRMGFFLEHRRPELYGELSAPSAFKWGSKIDTGKQEN